MCKNNQFLTYTLTVLLTVPLLLTGCGSNGTVSGQSNPTKESVATDGKASQKTRFLPVSNQKLCLAQLKNVTQAQSPVWSAAVATVGKQQAVSDPGKTAVEVIDRTVGSSEEIKNSLDQAKCGTVLGVDPQLDSALQQWANQHQESVVWSVGPLEKNKQSPESKNFIHLKVAADEVAFLAGYTAAGVTQNGQVAVLISTASMQKWALGFKQGVDYYNRFKGSGVKVANWDQVENQAKLIKIADLPQTVNDLQAKGVDIFYTLTGTLPAEVWPIISAKSGLVIWAGQDGQVVFPEQKQLILTSTMIQPENWLKKLFTQISKKQIDRQLDRLDLKNKAISLAPFKEQAPRISPQLEKELVALTTELAQGKLSLAELPEK